jgi:hypothetical protein
MPAYSTVEYNELFAKLVPAEGKCETLEGEILRAASRISYDYTNNGFGNNWSGALNFLDRYLHLTPEELQVLKPYARGRVVRDFPGMYEETDPILATCEALIYRAIERAKNVVPPDFPDMFDLQEKQFTFHELVEMGSETDGEE